MRETHDTTIELTRAEAEDIIAKYLRQARGLPLNADIRCELEGGKCSLDGIRCSESEWGHPECTGGTVYITICEPEEKSDA